MRNCEQVRNSSPTDRDNVTPDLPHIALALGYRKDVHHPINEERLQKALRVAAQVVVRYGEDYLPIFERLETELANLRIRSMTLLRAEQIAAGKLP